MSRVLPDGPYLVVDADTCAAASRRPADIARVAVGAGVRVLQVRAKRAPVRDLVALTVDVARAVDGTGALVVVDDRVDVALAARSRGCAVAGVHVGQADLDVADVRRLLGADAVVGVSAATAAHLAEVDPAVVDYVGAGPVRGTPTKPDAGPPLGLDGLRAAVRRSPLPVVAIGGLGVEDVAAVRETGAHGIAVVSAVCAAADPARAAADLVAAWTAAAGRSGPDVGAGPVALAGGRVARAGGARPAGTAAGTVRAEAVR
ncbi:thiamine phosphate synthase [Cellulomonas algicola]|uniref:thiamine phosphate synthase n=2 Tax=Cellulomonas algicola TaxID=2071633 RepID=UPI0027E1E0A2|nr:thiamine phosphate synthase [Cellulomonas algicola]